MERLASLRGAARQHPYATDALLAAALAVSAQLELWTNAEMSPRAVLVPCSLLTTVPLAWRRRAPLAAVAVARELHDVIAHCVSLIVVQAGAERRVLPAGQASTREALQSIERTGRQALVEMRRLVEMLDRRDAPLGLAPQPSVDELGQLVEQVRDAGLAVELRVEGDPRPLAPGVDLSAYRIVQEGLTNALKHAGPARARVTVRYGPGELDIEVADDGRGPDSDDGGGHGLVGMRERALLFGGTLQAGPRAEGGYALHATLPLGTGRP